MPKDWSRAEVEATVTDYLAMLDAEVRGSAYSKTAHRRALRAVLENRSEAAIERKHMNISAILRNSGRPFIDGYKPYGNYQQLLADVVEERLSLNHPLLELVEREASLPAALPSITDLLSIWDVAPAGETAAHDQINEPSTSTLRPTSGFKKDYLAIEANNRSLGRAGEELVLEYEAQRLQAAGAARLADRIEHVSATQGDGLGFDILSFNADGRERLIEVKTTSFGKRTPFFVTRNEIECSKARSEDYHIYRLFTFRRTPRLFGLQGPIDGTCRLTASQFVARVA